MLTNKQKLFTQEYLIDLNATQAAIRSGYSAKTAEWIGPKLLTKSHVAMEIKKAVAERSEKLNLSAQDVIQSILEIRAKAIQGERLGDALKANELLGKHLRLFTDKTEITDSEGRPINLIVNFVAPKLIG